MAIHFKVCVACNKTVDAELFKGGVCLKCFRKRSISKSRPKIILEPRIRNLISRCVGGNSLADKRVQYIAEFCESVLKTLGGTKKLEQYLASYLTGPRTQGESNSEKIVQIDKSREKVLLSATLVCMAALEESEAILNRREQEILRSVQSLGSNELDILMPVAVHVLRHNTEFCKEVVAKLNQQEGEAK